MKKNVPASVLGDLQSPLFCTALQMRLNPQTYRTPRCSRRIFVPIKIKMTPPMMLADFSNFAPKRLPIFTPTMENTKVVRPMTNTELHNSTWMQAKEMPTAKASMLVAMAKSNIVLKSRELSSCFSSPFEKDSRIILAPMRNSKPKAIQWSIDSMRCWNCSAR